MKHSQAARTFNPAQRHVLDSDLQENREEDDLVICRDKQDSLLYIYFRYFCFGPNWGGGGGVIMLKKNELRGD